MSSKKRKSDKNVDAARDSKEQKKHPGGLLQRTGTSADSWNEAVGSSLQVIPLTYLPTKRTILRRYCYLHMNDEPALASDLVKVISKEVAHIWNCCKHIGAVIEWWGDSSKNAPQYRMEPGFQQKLDELLDIAAKPKGRYTEEKTLVSE